MGFIRVAVIASIFGGGGQADLLNLLYSFPNNMRKLLAEGAFSSGIILVIDYSDSHKWKTNTVIRSISTVHSLFVFLFVFLLFLFAPTIVPYLFPFSSEKLQIAISLFRYFLLSIPFMALTALYMAVLHTRKDFLIPAITPILSSLAIIACILLFYKLLGVYAMATGVLIGGGLQFLVHVLRVKQNGFSVVPIFRVKKEVLTLFWKNVRSPFLIALLFVILQQVSMTLAALLPEGSGAAFTNALVIWQLPQGIFSQTVITVFFPLISTSYAHKDEQSTSKAVSQSLIQIIVFMIPSTFLLMFFSREIVSVVLQRGAFDHFATMHSATVLVFLAIGLFGVSLFRLLQRIAYALQKRTAVLFFTIVAIFIDIVFSIILIRGKLQVAGLGLAQSIAFSVVSLFFFIYLRKSLPSLTLIPIIRVFFQTIIISAFASLFLVLASFLWHDYWVQGSSFHSWGYALLTIFFFTIIVLGLYRYSGISLFPPKKDI